MRRTVGIMLLLAGSVGCGRAEPGAPAPDSCVEVQRIRLKAQLARANASATFDQAFAAHGQPSASMDPVERRVEEMERRRAIEQSRREAAARLAYARQLDSEASAIAGELRARGLECGRR